MLLTPKQPLEARSEVLGLPQIQECREHMQEAVDDGIFAEDRIQRSRGVGDLGQAREHQRRSLYQHGQSHRRRIKMQV